MPPAPIDDAILARLTSIDAQLNRLHTAFLLNDLGAPDYDGHRRDHAERIRQAAKLEDYKRTATKKIISVVLGVILTAAGTGLVRLILEKIG